MLVCGLIRIRPTLQYGPAQQQPYPHPLNPVAALLSHFQPDPDAHTATHIALPASARCPHDYTSAAAH
uniref:Uncharacterized protein n=1 Tax=Setaria italica TaxID=4555 RepID=K3ZFT0_SETIT